MSKEKIGKKNKVESKDNLFTNLYGMYVLYRLDNIEEEIAGVEGKIKYNEDFGSAYRKSKHTSKLKILEEKRNKLENKLDGF